jgi:MAF protein
MCTAPTVTDPIPEPRNDPRLHHEDARLSLASASPRRAELLVLTGMAFETSAADVDEAPRPGESPESLVRRLSLAKARRAAATTTGELVIAADTEVVLDGRVLGKPADREEATRMLARLRGRQHRVITAVTLLERNTGRCLTDTCETRVVMREYGDAELGAYVETDAPLDKAGGYGIQDQGFDPVDMHLMTGCYANVMGLPLCHLTRLLRSFGHRPGVDVPQACRRSTGYACTIFPTILQEPR